MFREVEEINIEDLKDFIETPSQDLKEEKQLQKYVDKIVVVLNKNPSAIMNITKNHEYIPSSFLLADLADKMKKAGCLEKLESLFSACSDELVENCIYNLYDLERCLCALPTCSEKITKLLISNEKYIKRILDSENDPEKTLKIISEKYPHCKEEFSKCYKAGSLKGKI